ncbi:MAG TPA: hypothetical protein VHO06_04550 [Polyangia bacterium]|nr:hypothetical protein [Polyangia bacterium]
MGAVAESDAGERTGELLARCALVDDASAWRALREHPTPLVLIPRGDVAAEVSAGSPHHIIVPIRDQGRADLTLPPIDSLAAAEPLKQAGLSEDEAAVCGKIARLSLLAARRRIATKPELHRPEWASTPASKLLRRLLLLGWWNEDRDEDRQAVADLVGINYDELREDFAMLLAQEDPVLTRLDASLALVSHVDAWLLLAPELRSDDLEAFEPIVFRVLGETDPRFDLPQDERWLAGVKGKVRQHSGALRSGMATALALLGAQGEATIAGSSLTGREWAGYFARELLKGANADATGNRWASLQDVLTDIAEAAPSEFLEAVSAGLSGESPVLKRIFMDQNGSALYVDAPHTSLLWALETCSWSPAHFGMAVDLLARLAEIDPGGRYSNRPNASLLSIFRPWFPQSSVAPERRLDVLDALRERHPATAWPLMLELLPDMHGFATHMHAPRFRDWKPTEMPVLRSDYWAFVGAVSERLFTDAGASAPRWLQVIEKLDDLSPHLRERGLAGLKEFATLDDVAPVERTKVWEALRALAARHREFVDAKWALPEVEITRVEDTAQLFEPEQLPGRSAWLFENELPDIPEIQRHDNFDDYNRALSELRARVARELADELEWPQLLQFARARELAWRFGVALAQAGVTRHEEEFLRLLDSDDNTDLQLGSGYLDQRFRIDGWAWAETHLTSGTLSPKQTARLLLGADDRVKAWKRADELGPKVAAAYWREFRPYGLGAKFPHVVDAAQRLLEAGRPAVALDLLSLYRRDEDQPLEYAEMIARGLEALLERQSDPEIGVLGHHDLVGVFAYLEKSDLSTDRLARLEWAYLQALGYDASPATLSGLLARDPAFFVDVVSRVYRPSAAGGTEDEEEEAEAEEEELTEQDRAVASNAYRLLSEWRTVPGKRDDGTVDGAVLNAWVDDALERLRGAGLLRPGEHHIGAVLAAGPGDPDGLWPCVVIRDLLERLQNAEIDHGMRLAIANRRGATSRGLLDGGDQERELAAKYREQGVGLRDKWPRMAAIVEDLAEGYEREARRHDAEAERRRRGFDR